MKILHVITGLGDGGAEAALYRLVVHDREDVHSIVSLTGEGKYGPLLRQTGAAVSALNMPRGRVTIRGLLKLWRLVHQARPDVVQTWMYHANLLGGLAGWLGRRPVIWGIHHTTHDPKRSKRTTLWVVRACAPLSHWLPARIMACAQAAVPVHAAMGYDARRMVVIPNGYELTRFNLDPEGRRRLRLEWGIVDAIPVLGMVARFDPHKDHSNLISALALLAQQGMEFRAVLVGAGIDAQNTELIAQIKAAGLSGRIQLLGPRSDIPAIMNALDVCALSSWGEAFPNVLAEAMACGTPCVTTDVGDAALIVGETGWLVPPRNPQALAEALRAAIEEWHNRPDTWRARQAAARQRIVERFGIEAMVQQYRAVWQAVAKAQ